jgi:hypothetical protein
MKMADLGFNFDSDSVEAAAGFALIPAGDYQAVIARTEIKQTKKGDGRYISATIEIVDSVCNGRLLWDNINFDNPNATAMKIAQQTLKAICTAVGIKTLRDTSELENKPLIVTIGVKRNDYRGEDENVIKAYKPNGVSVNGAVAAKPAAPVQDKAPWDR